MTELTFLVDLLLNHKLPKVTRDAVAARIKDVEGQMTVAPAPRAPNAIPLGVPAHLVGQAPSTIAALARHPDLAAKLEPAPVPVEAVAQTPAAAAAMNARQESIALAMSGKVEKGRTSPRKF